MGSGRLKGRKALITGGDSGIGRAAAIAYAHEVADVAIGYLPSEEADAAEVIELIEVEGRKAVGLAGDVKDEEWCRQMIEATIEGLGASTCSWSTLRASSLGEVSIEDFDVTMKTNLYALHTASVVAYHPAQLQLD